MHVLLCGLGCFPVTLDYEQWIREFDPSDQLRALLEENKRQTKAEPELVSGVYVVR